MRLAHSALPNASPACQAAVAMPAAGRSGLPEASRLIAQATAWYAPWRISRLGLAMVALGHALLLWWLLHYVTSSVQPPVPVLSVSLLTAPAEPAPLEPTPPPPEPAPQPQRIIKKPRPTPPLLASHQATPTPDSPAPQTEAQPEPAPMAPASPPAPPSAPAPAAAPAKAMPPRFDAAYLDNPRPLYPLLSRRMGEQGKVLLLVEVNAQGHPVSVQLHASSGSSRLDNAAIEAVRRWRFVPARQGDTTVAAAVIVPIDFSLKD